jgi:hypothetical protein
MLFIFFIEKPQEFEGIFVFNRYFMISLLFQWNPGNCNIMNIYPRSDGFDWDSYGKVNIIN